MNEIQKREDTLFERISALIDEARKRVVTAVNVAEVYTKYGIGQYIVEDEQQGEQRAKYGKAVLKNLSIRLTDKYGEGWSVETLDKCRKFYRVFSRGGISSTMQTKLTRRVIISQKDNFIRITLPISAHDHASDHASVQVEKLVSILTGEMGRSEGSVSFSVSMSLDSSL